MAEVPSRRLTFLFTDLESSTRPWERRSPETQRILAIHDALLRAVVEAQRGHVVEATGRSVSAVFERGNDAVVAALNGQRQLARRKRPGTEPLRVRMGIHTGEAELREAEYRGHTVDRAERLAAIAHGGQVLTSQATELAAREALPPGVAFVDLGEHRLPHLASPERVFQLTAPGLVETFPALQCLEVLPGNLPTQVTTFVGRGHDLAELAASLREARYVTLMGPGGVGKTRLALQAAERALPEYGDGAWWCDLAAVKEPTAVPAALASTLGVQQRQAQRIEESLLEFLRGKELLLVLDNCEHVVKEVARLMHAIGASCSRVTLLTTSRELIGVPGERVMAVEPLELPEEGMGLDDVSNTEAVTLFATRAADVISGFELTEENLESVADACRCVDGIPLAIEIVATRVKSMTPAEIALGLRERLGLLGAATIGPVDRHQTLRRTIDWSYDLLHESERRLFESLAVFPGGFTLDAATSIASTDLSDALAVEDLLTGLVRRSLVVADEHRDRTRYRMLEPIRQYAEELLEARGDMARIRRRHAHYYLREIVAATPHLRGADQLKWTPRVERDVHNFRAALDWAVEAGDVDVALRLVAPLPPGSLFGDTTLSWAETAITTRCASDHPLFPKIAAIAAIVAAMRGDLDQAAEISGQALTAHNRLGGDPDPLLFYSVTLAAVFTGEIGDAVEWSERAVEAARPGGDSLELVFCLAAGGWAHGFAGDRSAGIADLEAALVVARRLANPTTLAWALRWLGDWLAGVDSHRALRVLDEAVDVGTIAGHQYAVAQSRAAAASLKAQETDPSPALRALLDALDYQHQIGYVSLLVPTLVTLASTLCRAGDHEGAGVLRGAVEGIHAQTSLSPHVQELQSSTAIQLRELLGDDLLGELEALGAEMDERQTLDYAREHVEAILAAPVRGAAAGR
jgi:predicted ATPase/class 3 adenylate cyclase